MNRTTVRVSSGKRWIIRTIAYCLIPMMSAAHFDDVVTATAFAAKKQSLGYGEPVHLDGQVARDSNGEIRNLPQPQGRGVYSVRFSSDGSRLLIGADDLAAHIFETDQGRRTLQMSMSGRKELFFDPERNNFLEGHISEIAAVRFVPPQGDLLLTGDYFGEISAWDARDNGDGIGHEKSRLLSEYSFSEFTVSDDGSLILAGGAISAEAGNQSSAGSQQPTSLSHMGVIWRTADIADSSTVEPYRLLKDQHPDLAITAVAFSPSTRLAVTAGRRGRIVVWDISEEVVQVVASVPESHGKDQISGIFFENENQLISAGYDGQVNRWSIDGSELKETTIARNTTANPPEFILRLRPSPDRTRFLTSEVVVAESDEKQKQENLAITCWSTRDQQSIQRPLLSSPVNIPEADKAKAFRHDISWSSDGRQLLLVSDGSISVFDTADWTRTQQYRVDQGNSGNGLRSVSAIRGAFSPAVDGEPQRVATFDGRFSQLWDLNSGQHVAEFRTHAGSNIAVDFSADRNFVVTGSESIRLFNSNEGDPNHGRCLFRLPLGSTPQSLIADVAVGDSPEGMNLASVDANGILEAWKWAPGDVSPLTSIFEDIPQPDDDPIQEATIRKPGNAVAFSSNGRYLASSQRGRLRVWSIEHDAAGEKVKPLEIPIPDGYSCRFNDLDFSSEGFRLVAGGVAYSDADRESYSMACVWSISEDGLAELTGYLTANHSLDVVLDYVESREAGITAVAFDDLRNEILTGGADGRLFRCQLPVDGGVAEQSLSVINDLTLNNGDRPHKSAITSLDMSPNGRAASSDQEGHVWLWPPQAGEK